MAKFNNEFEYLIHLLKSVLNKTQPEEKPDNLSFETILNISKLHHVANMAYYAVEKLKTGPEENIIKIWAELRDRAIVKDLTQTFEFDLIINTFNKEKVRCLPLKGIFMKDLYPQRDMRTMSDIDMLVDEENMSKVSEIMTSLNYSSVDDEDDDHHDAYTKKPTMYVEVHKQLFGKNGGVYLEIFSNPWEHTNEVSPCLFNFSDDWFFLYLFAHLEKHYSKRGTGIRSIMDIYVYLKAKEKTLNWEMIYTYLDKIGKSQICRDIIQLSKIWFGDEKLSPKYEKMSNYVLHSGVYGTNLNSVLSDFNHMSTAKYILYRTFPPLKVMKKIYPTLNKVPVLLPVYWIGRIFSLAIFKRKNISRQINYLKDNK